MNDLPDEIKAKMNKRGLSHKEKNARKRKALDIEDIPPSGYKEVMLRYKFILPVAYGIVAFVILFDVGPAFSTLFESTSAVIQQK